MLRFFDIKQRVFLLRFFDNKRRIFSIIFFDLVRQRFLLRFFDKEFVEKYYTIQQSTRFFFAKKHHKFSTLYAKKLPHFSHRLEVFGEICWIMSKNIVLYSVFWQDFSLRFDNSFFRYDSTANDNIFCIAWLSLAKIVMKCQKKLYYFVVSTK